MSMRRKAAVILEILLYTQAFYVILFGSANNPSLDNGEIPLRRREGAQFSVSTDTETPLESDPLNRTTFTKNAVIVQHEEVNVSGVSNLNTSKVETKKKGKYLRYNICNGLSNQLLIHAAYIARAKQQGLIVQIPDYFITNGVQMSDDNVIPNANNSIPFGQAFDRPYFRQQLEQLGVDARFVSFSTTTSRPPPKCSGIGMVKRADPFLVRQILEAFRPSQRMQRIIDRVTTQMIAHGLRDGVCVHHRDGNDWHNHCERWGSITDNVYRGNCLGVPNRTFTQSLQDRGLNTSKWVYYCGDHEAPLELKNAGYRILSQSDVISPEEMSMVHHLSPKQEARDLWALVDFFACSDLPHFIGNSVSTFSALQIALKDGAGAYWYNSRSIPLSHMWHIYQIPIVYTYTETSASMGQIFLKSSITSVRRQMPHNKIHVLYHGGTDANFRVWLAEQKVIVHNHYPEWQNKIEEMRKNGDPQTSHLFLHPGNYLGTWQRIDIPLFLDTEYCLLLDSDTVIHAPFTLADFGLNMTYGIAMSSEMHMQSTQPSNAGVTLMNIPFLRQTHKDFLQFIYNHVDNPIFGKCPSDQGAYLEYYKNQNSFLDRSFNMKPYWPAKRIDFNRSRIVHFHGPKPHDYLGFLMGNECNKAFGKLCSFATRRQMLCHALREFAIASSEIDGLSLYCNASFSNVTQQSICKRFLGALGTEKIECVPQKLVTLEDLDQVL